MKSLRSALQSFSLPCCVIATLALLVACEEESNGPSGPPGPELTVESIKQFRFDWPASATGSHYRILENPDGRSGFTDISGDIPLGTESFSMEVPLHGRISAQYILQRCDGSDCSDSRATTVTGNLANGIGYFKPDTLVSAGYHFGRVVALSGDGKTLAIAGDDELYIFVEATAGQWQQQQKIDLRSPATGLALSRDGSRLAVGSRLDASDASGIHDSLLGVSSGGAIDSGAAYVFSRSGSDWSLQAFIKASNVAAGTYFGHSIGFSDDGRRLAVGAYSENNDAAGISTSFPGSGDTSGQDDSGAVYLYRYGASQWTQDAYIKASNVHDAWFGFSLSLSGDGNRLVVGAIEEDNNARGVSSSFPGPGDIGTVGDPNTPWNSGAAYIYYHNGTNWTEEAYIKASNARTAANFGASVSLNDDGDLLAVGAKEETTNMVGVHQQPSTSASHNRYYSGAVYVYARTGSDWSDQAFIKAGNTDNGDRFGIGVRLSGDGRWLAVVAKEEESSASGIHASSRQQNDNSIAGFGAVYLYRTNNSLWTEQAYIKPSNTQDGYGGFGFETQPSFDLSDDAERLAVGMWAEDSLTTGIQGNQNDHSGNKVGAVYLY